MKFEITSETKVQFGVTLHRIRALQTIAGVVAAGALGGWIEKPENLSQDGDAWVYGNARVYGNALVYGNARVYGNALVYGDADVIQVGPALSSGRFTSAHVDTSIAVRVNCGCFSGTVEQFEAAIESTHASHPAHLAQYRAFAALIKAHFAAREMLGGAK